jgi:heterodisulfide reductase subunit B2
MDYGFFPGCSLSSTAKEYKQTVEMLAENFDITLREIEDWNCCGATPAAAVSEEVSLALPWCNLAAAEKMGLDRVLSPCPACHSHMCTSHEAAEDETLTARLDQLTEANYSGKVKLRHLLDFLTEDVGLEQIEAKAKKPLLGVRAVCYYGCLTRLHGVDVDDRELPTKMEQILQAAGAETLDFSHATDCCGASLVLSKTDSVLRLSNNILQAAQKTGANCVVVVCPICQGNLDMRQKAIEKKYGVSYQLPIVYLSQLLVLSQGADYKQAGLNKHFVSPEALYQTAFTAPADDGKKKKRKKKKERILA